MSLRAVSPRKVYRVWWMRLCRNIRRNRGLNLKMVRFGQSSKGNAILDVMLIIVLLFVLGLGALYGSKIFGELDAEIQADTDMHNITRDTSGDLYGKYNSLMDNLLMFAFVLLVMFVLISVFTLDTHPIFFITTVILLVFVFIVAMMLANSYDDIARDSELSSIANNLPYMTWLWNHVVTVTVGIAFLVAIVMYIKYKNG